jgi:hypothetical protein
LYFPLSLDSGTIELNVEYIYILPLDRLCNFQISIFRVGWGANY